MIKYCLAVARHVSRAAFSQCQSVSLSKCGEKGGILACVVLKRLSGQTEG